MKRAIFIIMTSTILVIIASVALIFVLDNVLKKEVFINVESDYIEVLGFDSSDYPKTPEDVISINNSIIKILYSQKLEEAEIEFLIDKQRLLFSEELLIKNNHKDHLELSKYEIAEMQNANALILDIRKNPPIYDGNSNKICTIIVTQIFQDTPIKKFKYYLLNENDEFKIIAWEQQEVNN